MFQRSIMKLTIIPSYSLHGILIVIYILTFLLQSYDMYYWFMGEEITFGIWVVFVITCIIGLCLPFLSTVFILILSAFLVLAKDINPIFMACVAVPGILYDIVGFFMHKRKKLRQALKKNS